MISDGGQGDPHDVESEEFLARLVSEVGAGIGAYGRDGRIVYVNDAYADLLGYDREEVVGMGVWEINPDFDREEFDRYWVSFGPGETRAAEARNRRRDGTVIPVDTVTTRIDVAGAPYHVGTIRDVTEEKRRQSQLQRQKERLEEFASIVSHDLKNPLNIAQGHLDLARQGVGDADEQLAKTETALDRIEEIVGDVLALARQGRTVGGTEPVSLRSVARGAWSTVDAPDATLEVETDRTVEADEERLRTLLENCFHNSVDHGGPGVTVTVADTATGEGFAVSDDGPGVPPDRRESVFEHGYTEAEDGTGLGLSIVRSIAEAHGWTVSLEAGESGGARFVFDLTGAGTDPVNGTDVAEEGADVE